MDNFFQRLLSGSLVMPGRLIKSAFHSKFPDAVNVEWFEWNQGYEAVFYIENREFIAHYEKDGALVELRENIAPGNFEGKIANIARTYGEVMNVIRIEKLNVILFEIIYRTSDLVRYFLLLDEKGKELAKDKL